MRTTVKCKGTEAVTWENWDPDYSFSLSVSTKPLLLVIKSSTRPGLTGNFLLKKQNKTKPRNKKKTCFNAIWQYYLSHPSIFMLTYTIFMVAWCKYMYISIKNRNFHNVPKVCILFELNLCMGVFQQELDILRRLEQIGTLFHHILSTFGYIKCMFLLVTLTSALI